MDYFGFSIFLVSITFQLISFHDCAPSGNVPVMPSECEDKNFCFIKSPNYPDDKFDKIISTTGLTSVNEPVEIAEREGTEKEVCRVKKDMLPIYEIRDSAGAVRYVAQHEKFVQNFTIAECVNPGRITDEKGVFPRSLIDLYELVCEEIMSSPQFLVLSDDEEHLELVTAAGGIPMGCVCRLN